MTEEERKQKHRESALKSYHKNKNKESNKNRVKSYYEANKEKINDRSKEYIKNNKESIKLKNIEYAKEHPTYYIWKNIVYRCNSKYWNKRPTYTNTKMGFKNFNEFEEWYNKNYYKTPNEKMVVDKDLFSNGEKIYSPETCCILPNSINTMLGSNIDNRNINKLKYYTELYKQYLPEHIYNKLITLF